MLKLAWSKVRPQKSVIDGQGSKRKQLQLRREIFKCQWRHWHFLLVGESVATPLWGKCEVATHIPENGIWESSRIPENSELDRMRQNTLHWGVLYTVGKVSKCRCLKWPHMSHLDICSTSYGWMNTKSRESTWSRCVQVECNTSLESSQRELQVCIKFHPNRRLGREVMNAQSPGSPNQDSFGTPFWESRGKSVIRMQVRWRGTNNTIWGTVVASPEFGPWWVKWVQGCPWLIPTPRVFRMSINQLVGWFWMQDRVTK
jgi:hypothetical protein